MHSTLRRFDLNLLLVFDALYRRRSVSAAADELAMSPSACSHALTRLRGALGDELFVRYGSAMQPTALAEHLAEGVADALRALNENLGSAGPFDPATSGQTFVIAATDFTAFAILPALIARIRQLAPLIKLKVVHLPRRRSMDDLEAGRIHLAISFADQRGGTYEGIESDDLLTGDYVVAARRNHPRVAKGMTLQQYLAEQHVAVTPWSDQGSVIDATLDCLGLERHVMLQLPDILVAPFTLIDSDLLLVLPRLVADQLKRMLPLVVHPIPFDGPSYTVRMYFHAKHTSQACHWLRKQLAEAMANLY